jgi:hypothetical protein
VPLSFSGCTIAMNSWPAALMLGTISKKSQQPYRIANPIKAVRLNLVSTYGGSQHSHERLLWSPDLRR